MGRTQKNYYEDNREKIAEYKKQYRQDNHQIIAEKNKQKTICVCGSETTIIHKKRHERSQKHKSFVENQQLQSI